MLKKALMDRGMKPCENLDPCLYCGNGVIVCCFVDDVLFFSKDKQKIRDLIKSLKQQFQLTEEAEGEDVFSFLGVEVTKNPTDGTITLKQTGLIKKVLAYCGMSDCNDKDSPANSVPLGSDVYGPLPEQEWEYASAVGMLMYLSSNSRPDIQYAVHQCARFTHSP